MGNVCNANICLPGKAQATGPAINTKTHSSSVEYISAVSGQNISILVL